MIRRRALVLSVAISVLALGGGAIPASAQPPSPASTAASSVTSAGWTYLALGDSNVYGPAEYCGSCRTYPHLLAERITQELKVPVRLIDGSQWNRLTSQRLLEEIQQDSWGEDWEQPRDPSLGPRAAIDAADLITITVAANELPYSQDPDPCGGTYDQACRDRVVTTYAANLDGILGEIAEDRGDRPTAVRVTTLYNDLVSGPGYDPTWYYSPEFLASSTASATALLDALNAAMRGTTEAHGALIVDMHAVANGHDGSASIPTGWFSATYGDLNQAGQDAFAGEIAAAGYAPLQAPVAR